MRIAFLGTSEFACPSLEALRRSAHAIACVATQPDRPAGRGLVETATPVKEAALAAGLEVVAFADLNAPDGVARLREAAPDLLVVVAFGQILSEEVLRIAPRGAINLHASLLPRWRGAAPIQHAIMAGDRETGNSVIRLVRRMDAGPVLAREAVPIPDGATAGDLAKTLAPAGAALLAATVDRISAGEAVETPQDEALATYAPSLKKEEGHVLWDAPPARVLDRIRGVTPRPGAYGFLATQDGRRMRVIVHQARPGRTATTPWPPGTVVAVDSEGLAAIQCALGTIELLRVQPEGGKSMRCGDFARGHRLRPGDRFE